MYGHSAIIVRSETRPIMPPAIVCCISADSILFLRQTPTPENIHHPTNKAISTAYQITAVTRIDAARPIRKPTRRQYPNVFLPLAQCLTSRSVDHNTQVIPAAKGISLGLLKMAPKYRGYSHNPNAAKNAPHHPASSYPQSAIATAPATPARPVTTARVYQG